MSDEEMSKAIWAKDYIERIGERAMELREESYLADFSDTSSTFPVWRSMSSAWRSSVRSFRRFEHREKFSHQALPIVEQFQVLLS